MFFPPWALYSLGAPSLLLLRYIILTNTHTHITSIRFVWNWTYDFVYSHIMAGTKKVTVAALREWQEIEGCICLQTGATTPCLAFKLVLPTSKSASVSQSSPSDSTFMATLCPTADFHICVQFNIQIMSNFHFTDSLTHTHTSGIFYINTTYWRSNVVILLLYVWSASYVFV